MRVYHVYAAVILFGLFFLSMQAPAWFADDPWLRWTARFIAIMALTLGSVVWLVRSKLPGGDEC